MRLHDGGMTDTLWKSPERPVGVLQGMVDGEKQSFVPGSTAAECRRTSKRSPSVGSKLKSVEQNDRHSDSKPKSLQLKHTSLVLNDLMVV